MKRAIWVYSPQELKDHDPKAFKRAHEAWKERRSGWEIPWSDETIGSLKALVKASGAELQDWSLGAYSQSWIRVHVGQAEDLQGQRAVAWLENNLLSRLRIPWHSKRRWEVSRFGEAYRAGKVPPCPFTGYCADDDYLDALQEAIKRGDTLKEAFESLADVCRNLLESEQDYSESEDAFLQDDDLEITEEGAIL